MIQVTNLLNWRIPLFAVIATLLCLNLWMGSAVSADEARPCADDVAMFCKDVQPGGGRIVQCLKQHENELSPACKQRIIETKQKLRGVHQACQDDVLKLCKDVQPGAGRLIRCLKDHENEVSAECKAKISEMKRK
jgi:hypothetical protein